MNAGFHELTSLIEQIYEIIKQVSALLLTICVGTGIISGPATDEPITFTDSDSCQMAFVALADTQTWPVGFGTKYLDYGFDDMAKAQGEFDALLIAGDITEMGDRDTFEAVWNEIENSIFADKSVFLATGNHDIRLNYEGNTKMIMDTVAEHLGIEIDKAYYSYDVKGYTFIVMGSDKWQLEKAVISDEQLEFLDSELARATKDGKPAFVVCHQPLSNTHGLPEVWENGDLGADSEKVRQVLTKYENVFYLNGHLHDGVYEKSLEVLDEEKGVYSVNLPAYGPENDYGEYLQSGLGAYVEVYSDSVVFTARDFREGKALEGYTYTFNLK